MSITAMSTNFQTISDMLRELATTFDPPEQEHTFNPTEQVSRPAIITAEKKVTSSETLRKKYFQAALDAVTLGGLALKQEMEDKWTLRKKTENFHAKENFKAQQKRMRDELEVRKRHIKNFMLAERVQIAISQGELNLPAVAAVEGRVEDRRPLAGVRVNGEEHRPPAANGEPLIFATLHV